MTLEKPQISPDDVQDVTEMTEHLVDYTIEKLDDLDKNIARNILIGVCGSLIVKYNRSIDEVEHFIECQCIAINQIIKMSNENKEMDENG